MWTTLLLAAVIQFDAADELSSLLERVRPVHSTKDRLAALKKLSRIGEEDSKRTIAALAPFAREEDAKIRELAVLAIGISGSDRLACPLPVVKALTDRAKTVRLAGATVLSFYQRYQRNLHCKCQSCVGSDAIETNRRSIGSGDPSDQPDQPCFLNEPVRRKQH